jgi:hypothetical protein
MLRIFTVMLLGSLAGCGGKVEPVIKRTLPLPGSTAVDTSIIPLIEVGAGGKIDGNERKIVLFDVTSGARLTVAAQIEIGGTILTYRPQQSLAPNHDFELVMEQGSITGEKLDEVDASESPAEPFSWPYRLWFSTKERPRVRSAYLEAGPAVLVHFSQAMNPISTSSAIHVLDLTRKPVPQREIVWLDEQSIRLSLTPPLDVSLPYTLQVEQSAESARGTHLDGNDDGTPGGADDTFGAEFTGAQPVIFSRLKKQ